MDIPEGLNLTNLEASLQAWSQQWPWSGDVRIRLTAFREGAGAYAPSTDGVSWVATGAPLSEVGFRLPAKGCCRGYTRRPQLTYLLGPNTRPWLPRSTSKPHGTPASKDGEMH